MVFLFSIRGRFRSGDRPLACKDDIVTFLTVVGLRSERGTCLVNKLLFLIIYNLVRILIQTSYRFITQMRFIFPSGGINYVDTEAVEF